MTVGERIRRARQSVGATQSDIAKALGVTRTAVSKLEAGARSLSAHEAVLVAGFLDVPIEDVLDTPEPDPLAGADVRGTLTEDARDVAREAVERGRLLARALAGLGADERLPDSMPIRFGAELPRLPVLAVLMGQRAGGAERTRLGLGSSGQRPLGILLDEMGFVVCSADLPPALSGISVPNVGYAGLIVVNRNDLPARQRFTLARQYGALLFRGAVPPEAEDVRASLWRVRAESFASSFLVAPDTLQSDLAEMALLTSDASRVALALTLARAHGVSATSIVHRAAASGVLEENGASRLIRVLGAHGRSIADLLAAGPQAVFDEVDASLIRVKRLALALLASEPLSEELTEALDALAPGFIESARATLGVVRQQSEANGE